MWCRTQYPKAPKGFLIISFFVVVQKLFSTDC
jgi:hypothetical protein